MRKATFASFLGPVSFVIESTKTSRSVFANSAPRVPPAQNSGRGRNGFETKCLGARKVKGGKDFHFTEGLERQR